MRLFERVKDLRAKDPEANILFGLVNSTRVHVLCCGPLFHENGTDEAIMQLIQDTTGSCLTKTAVKKALKLAETFPLNCSAEIRGI